jgi:hypothetical protein
MSRPLPVARHKQPHCETELPRTIGRFTRAIKQRNLFQAEIAAREMRGLSLADALELVILIAAQRPDRLERAAVRWHGRLEVELPMLTLAESRFALAALERLPDDEETGGESGSDPTSSRFPTSIRATGSVRR